LLYGVVMIINGIWEVVDFFSACEDSRRKS
jgi:uncharacterized membrane protein HdeD (DUF308 family)